MSKYTKKQRRRASKIRQSKSIAGFQTGGGGWGVGGGAGILPTRYVRLKKTKQDSQLVRGCGYIKVNLISYLMEVHDF